MEFDHDWGKMWDSKDGNDIVSWSLVLSCVELAIAGCKF